MFLVTLYSVHLSLLSRGMERDGTKQLCSLCNNCNILHTFVI